MYSIVIQLGAILCLPIYFRSRIAKFISNFPKGERGDRTAANHPLTLVMIAFVCTAIPAFLLTKLIGKHLENLVIMGWSLLLGGIVMWIVDALYGSTRTIGRHATERVEEMSMPQAVWIGLCQNLSAIFPGTSRSMSTIAAGQLAGMSRTAALEFSFFLSMPTMIAATGYDLLRTLHPKHGAAPLGSMPADSHQWVVLIIGFVVSFIVALRIYSVCHLSNHCGNCGAGLGFQRIVEAGKKETCQPSRSTIPIFTTKNPAAGLKQSCLPTDC
jgi:undecaprenyl-diphosphatase